MEFINCGKVSGYYSQVHFPAPSHCTQPNPTAAVSNSDTSFIPPRRSSRARHFLRLALHVSDEKDEGHPSPSSSSSSSSFGPPPSQQQQLHNRGTWRQMALVVAVERERERERERAFKQQSSTTWLLAYPTAYVVLANERALLGVTRGSPLLSSPNLEHPRRQRAIPSPRPSSSSSSEHQTD